MPRTAFAAVLLAALVAAPALAQSPSDVRPLPPAPRSVELAGFTLDAPDGWRITRHQGEPRPMAQLQPVPLTDSPEVTALTLSIPDWRTRAGAEAAVVENYGLVELDSAWTKVVVGADTASVRAFDPPPGAPVARTAVLALESGGRVAAVFLTSSEARAPERMRALAVEVAGGLRRHDETPRPAPPGDR